MIRLLVTVELHGIGHHLFLRNVFENQELGVVLIIVIKIIVTSLIGLIVEEALCTGVRSTHRRVDSSVRNRGRPVHGLIA